MTELIGHRLGQYEVKDQIAKGGMATVYRAYQSTMKRDVAIKVLPSNFTHEDSFLERFYREVEIIASLQHPHILPVYDFGEYENLPYIVMAYLSGGTLGDVMQQGVVPSRDVIRIVRQVADALDFAHSREIIHRDLKPGNVLLDERGNTYLADFGLARITAMDSNITGAAILGTPAYMAPELAGPDEPGAGIDVYALGVTIYQMLTGHPPYESHSPSGILMAHLMQDIPDIRLERSDLPDSIQAVINKALAKEVPDRYASAGELAEDLIAILDGRSSSASIVQEDPEPDAALLMTNMLGRVIFVDNQVLRILRRKQSELRSIMGNPLHKVLGCDKKITNHIMKEIAAGNELHDIQLEIKDARGRSHEVLLSAVPTHDEDGEFVGADLSLMLASGELSPTLTELSAIRKPDDTREEHYLEDYFKAQIDAIYDIMLQWGGERIAANLEDIINEISERNVWSVHMEQGHITVQLGRADTDIYRALLARAMSYAAKIIGKRIVIKKLQAVDKNTSPAILQFVEKLGMHQLYKDVL